MPFHVGTVTIDEPVLLAPMAGITDLPFRRLVARFGAGLVVSEMVASREAVTAGKAAAARMMTDDAEVPCAVQIAGCEAHWMAEAARLAEGSGARIIDINMGCPAKKVTTGWSGSALMREPDRALTLIEAVVGAVRVPVTLKMRLGWDHDSLNAPDIAARAVDAGVQMITVHGRTRQQFYKGKADWTAIRRVREAIRVPLVANGDITDAASARQALAASGADAVMIGRGAQGAPWLPQAVADAMAGRAVTLPSTRERLDLLAEQYDAMLGFYGRDIGLRVARKHIGWTLDRIPGAAPLRQRLMRADEPATVLSALKTWQPDTALERAA
jgi:tRNA-dihydrouridine synthase B